MDAGQKMTDQILKDMGKELDKIYAQASKEIQGKLNDYMRRFEVKDSIKRRSLNQGLITEAEYKKWRTGQIMIGKRWEEMQAVLARDLTNTNKIAASIINGHTPDAYVVGRNYGAFQASLLAKEVGLSYTLYDRHTVERLIKNQPDLLPKAKVDIPKDLRWNKQKINSAVAQGVLQGEDIRKISRRLQSVTDMDRTAAVRNARTMITSAENGGRLDSYTWAQDMGIPMEKQWLATLDGRVRKSHAAQDGEHVPLKEEFTNGLMFPADPDGDPREVCNCRCTMLPVPADADTSVNPNDVYRNSRLGGMDYDEWIDSKRENTPTLVDMIDRDRSKFGNDITYKAARQYAQDGTFPKGVSSYQKKKAREIVDNYENGVHGRSIKPKKVPAKAPAPQTLKPHTEYKVPTDTRSLANKWVRDQSLKCGYSKAQLSAMEEYMMYSDDINDALRMGSKYYDQSVIKNLSASMTKYRGRDCVYRGVDGEVLGIGARDSLADIKSKLLGKDFTDKGFLSTSRAEDVAREFSGRGAAGAYEATRPCVMVLDIQGVGVTYVNSGLAEVLLENGCTITFTDAVDSEGVLKLYGKVRKKKSRR